MKSLIRLFWFITLVITPLPLSAQAISSTLVISQVYLGTGGIFAPKSQYVEIFNKGTTTINLSTWSLQYAAEGTTPWQVFPLSGSMAPGQYYLISVTGTTNPAGTISLPPPDLTIATLSLPQNVGKLILASAMTPYTNDCPLGDPTLIDLVGYGTTGCFKGRALIAPQPADLLAFVRKAGGCIDMGINSADFTSVTPVFRNTASSLNLCSGTSGTKSFSIPDDGGTSFRSSGGSSGLNGGYARIQPASGSVTPGGVAIFGLRQGGTLVSETGVPAAPLVTSGLTYVEIDGAATTG